MSEPVAESWEDETPAVEEATPAVEPAAAEPKMNPFAANFNPNAGAFVPSWMKKEEPAAAPAAAPAAPVAEPLAAEPAAAAEPTEAAAPAPVASAKVAEVDAEQLAKLSVSEEATPGEAKVSETKLSKKFAAPEMTEEEKEKKKMKLVNIIFIGHVDAGKSTLSGHIMYLTGMLDDRTLEKYQQEAKSKGRESWAFAWALDVTDQERAKGKTEECGRASFEYGKKRFVIIDAPGHKSFVPHMIGGAAQADVAVMVLSARKGEFETGFEKGGQTREHALLAKTAGVRQLIVAINKMDDPTVEWSVERYQECIDKFTPYLKQVGFNTDVVKFMPISGLGGHNIRDRIAPGIFDYYKGPSLLEWLNDMRAPKRLLDMPLRMPIVGGYKEMGFIAVGKIEAGTAHVNGQYLLMPTRTLVRVEAIAIESDEGYTVAETGDNVRLMIKGVADEKEIATGYVLCDPLKPVKVTKQFLTKVSVMESKNIICAGYSCIMHIHTLTVECKFADLLAVEDKKSKKIVQKKPPFVRASEKHFVVVRMEVDFPICLENFGDFAQLGRFMLRDEGKTIGIGVVTKIKEEEIVGK